LRIFVAAARGVSAAHARGVVHRDLKPGNVLLGRDGTVKVLDFGLATLSGGQGAVQQGALVGTPAYMAPEQVEGERASPSADLYSLGVVLYEMLTGELPFRGQSPLATALARLSDEPDDPCSRNPAVPGWLGSVVLRCLEREPTERYPTVERLLQDLSSRASEADRETTHTLALPPRFARSRIPRIVRRYAPLALVVVGMLITLPSFRRAVSTPRDSDRIFADGVVRIAVADFEEITSDPATRLVSSGLAEALRSRLSQLEGVRVVSPPGFGPSTPGELLDALGVEQVLGARVGRLGGQLKVLLSVSTLPGHERWMTFERSLDWQDTWEQIDALATEILAVYSERLSLARRAAA
jgi:serine/threonine-protein kinase